MTTNEIAVRGEPGFDIDEIQRLDSRNIPKIQQEIESAKQLIFTVLEKDVDYGHTPGTQGTGLWDPGASKIIRAFHCHVEHKVIYHDESDELVTWTIEANLIHNASREIVGQGVGSASTRETKYKYRWVKKSEALSLGYSEEDIAELKIRDSKADPGVTEYRVVNPEYGDLANTLLLMASKRAEVDGAKSLPGVGSALRILFDPKLFREKGFEAIKTTLDKPDYRRFWSIVKGMGLTEESTHRALGVSHMEEWISAGHSLDEAVALIGKKLVELATRPKKEFRKEDGAVEAPNVPQPPLEPEPKASADGSREYKPLKPTDIQTVDDLISYAQYHWGLSEMDIWKILRYVNRQNFLEAAVQTPYEAYQDLLLYRQVSNRKN